MSNLIYGNFSGGRPSDQTGPSEPTPTSPLEHIYGEIAKAISGELYYLAIVVTTSLPDVCSALEGNVPTNWETYKTWFRENVGDNLAPFGEHECYELRCGVMHQARFMGAAKNKWSDYEALFFTLPNGAGFRIDRGTMFNIGGDARRILAMELTGFCNTIIEAAREWERKKKHNPDVEQRMKNIARVRPQGLSPYFINIPVFA